jgi:hypothetical protein
MLTYVAPPGRFIFHGIAQASGRWPDGHPTPHLLHGVPLRLRPFAAPFRQVAIAVLEVGGAGVLGAASLSARSAAMELGGVRPQDGRRGEY